LSNAFYRKSDLLPRTIFLYIPPSAAAKEFKDDIGIGFVGKGDRAHMTVAGGRNFGEDGESDGFADVDVVEDDVGAFYGDDFTKLEGVKWRKDEFECGILE
jgi:hypothetical protein